MTGIFHIAVCRKPISENTVAQNVVKHGVGGLNIDGCRIEGKPRTTHASGNIRTRTAGPTMNEGFGIGERASPSRRFPANLITDGSDEVVGEFPQTGLSSGGSRCVSGGLGKHIYGKYDESDVALHNVGLGDSGSASRFFKRITT